MPSLWSIFSLEAAQTQSAITPEQWEWQGKHALVSQHVYEGGFRPSYPSGKSWGVLISHDVDWLNYPGRGGKYWGMRQMKRILSKEWKAFFQAFGHPHDKRVPAYDLSHILQENKSREIPATFFLQALEKGEADYNYSLEEMNDQWQLIREAGHEMGLHGGLEAFDKEEVLACERQRLLPVQPDIKGYRNHFLRFAYPTSYRLLASQGFAYDATLGYTRKVGFVNGMCYPFKPFDRSQHKFLDIYEFPIHVMDVCLFLYLNLSPDQAMKEVKKMVEEIKAVQGVFSLLWHNNYLHGRWGDFYRELLDYLVAENPAFMRHRDLLAWWEGQGYNEELNRHLLHLKKENIMPTS